MHLPNAEEFLHMGNKLVAFCMKDGNFFIVILVFPNGNGRHARLFADLVLSRVYNHEPLPWGGAELGATGSAHDTYIKAMTEADAGNFQPLLEFATKDG